MNFGFQGWKALSPRGMLRNPNADLSLRRNKPDLLLGFVMGKDEEYRRRAADAQSWADKAKSDADREAWVRVAQGWLLLIKNRPPSEEEAFEERLAAEGTGQQRSNESH
jgi:hypothetical protein